MDEKAASRYPLLSKQAESQSQEREKRVNQRRLTSTVVTLSVLAGLTWLGWTCNLLGYFRYARVEPVKRLSSDWSTISPTKELIWYHCYEKYDCAKLDVPLDWLDPTDGLRASIAIIRYNATDRANYKGPVFINPGGPGGSGVYYVKQLAPYYQTVVGKNHDIIGFDPRGVGKSTPRIDCWDTPQNGRIWDMKEVDVIDAHPGALYDAYARATAFSKQCAATIGGGNGTSFPQNPAERRMAEAGPGRFVSTASVARDLLEMMEKVGEKRLRYWGFSYGTLLGATFAAMYPDKIERMVNDGNVDAREWSAGQPIHFVQDADKIMDAFYRFCHLAGPKLCSFWAPSSLEIESRLETLLRTIRKHPVIVPAPKNSGKGPEIVSFSSLRRMIGSVLYRPLIMFPAFADALNELEKGNGQPFTNLSGQGVGDPLLCESDPGLTPEAPEVEGTADTFKAVLCSDAGLMSDTVDDFGQYVDTLVGISKSTGAMMAHMRLGCMGWAIEAKWRFPGPFVANTSFPLLFVANIGDGVTPLRSARQNANGFPGSEVLVLNSYGHTTLAMPSRCTSKAINAYFQHGILPAPNTTCEPDLVLFQPWNLTSAKTASSVDSDLDTAMLRLMEAPLLRF